MKNEGHGTRLHCETTCILNYGGINYQGTVENISLTGALIKLSGIVPDTIRPGEICGLMLCSDPDQCSVKYTCKVARIDSARIGVQFLELNCNI